MSNSKKILRRILSTILVIIMAFNLTACDDVVFDSALKRVVALSNGLDVKNSGLDLSDTLDAKFNKYEEILNKLAAAGAVTNPESYRSAFKTNKDYLVNFLTSTDTKLDSDILASIPWMLDPQYFSRLYNDLQVIQRTVAEQDSADKYNYGAGYMNEWNISEKSDQFWYMNVIEGDGRDLSDEIDIDDIDISEYFNDPEGTVISEKEKNDRLRTVKALKEADAYYQNLEQLIYSGVSRDQILYTLSVMDSLNEKFDIVELLNKVESENNKAKSGLLDKILSWFGIGNTGTTPQVTNKKIKPFKKLPAGTITPNDYTIDQENAGQDILLTYAGMENTIKAYYNSEGFQQRSKVAGIIQSGKYFKQELEDGIVESYGGVEDDKAIDSLGFTIKLANTFVYHEGDRESDITDDQPGENGEDNSNEADSTAYFFDDWIEKCDNTCEIAFLLYSQARDRLCSGGRHTVGGMKWNISKSDPYKLREEDEFDTIDYTFELDVTIYTTAMMFLNVDELHPFIISGYTQTNINGRGEKARLYRTCCEAIARSEKTLIDIPYVWNPSKDMSTISKVVDRETKPTMEGYSLCAPNVRTTGKRDLGINTPIKHIQFVNNVGDYSIDKFRKDLKEYSSITGEAEKKKRGDNIDLYVAQKKGEDAFLETNTFYKTSDYTRHEENLKYKNVLKSICLGNQGSAAIDFNPSNEIGNDLIVVIAGIPAFAIRLAEFDENAHVLLSESQRKALQDGYIMITNSKNQTYALDPRCSIKVIDSINPKTNEVKLVETDNVYNFQTGQIYKHDGSDKNKPADGILINDREYITSKFYENNNFNHYFGPNSAGSLTLTAYEPLFFEPELAENNQFDQFEENAGWFPLGRTLYLDQNNVTIDLSNDPEGNTMIISDATKPVGYLSNPRTNQYSESAGAPVTLDMICDKDNQKFNGEYVERNSIYSTEYEEGMNEEIFKDISSGFKKDAITLNGDIQWQYLDENDLILPVYLGAKEDKVSQYFDDETGLIKDNGYYYIRNTINGVEKYYLYYVDEDGFVYYPPDEDGYDVTDDWVICNSKNPEGFSKPLNNTSELLEIMGLSEFMIRQADILADEFEQNGSKDYTGLESEGYKKDVPFIGETNVRKDCSSYATLITLFTDKEQGYEGDHFFDPSQKNYLFGTTAYAGAVRKDNYNWTITPISGITKDNMKSKLQPGDFLFSDAGDLNDKNESGKGHIFMIASVDDKEVKIYHWTSLHCQGGPVPVPISYTQSLDGMFMPMGNMIQVQFPDTQATNRSYNNINNYKYIIRNKNSR